MKCPYLLELESLQILKQKREDGGGGCGGLLWVQFSIGGASDFYYIIAHFL